MASVRDVKGHSCMSWFWPNGELTMLRCGLLCDSLESPRATGPHRSSWWRGTLWCFKHRRPKILNYSIFTQCIIEFSRIRWECIMYHASCASCKIPQCDFLNFFLDQQCVVTVLPPGSAKFILHSWPDVGDWTEYINSEKSLTKLRISNATIYIFSQVDLASVLQTQCFYLLLMWGMFWCTRNPPEKLVIKLRIAPNLREPLRSNVKCILNLMTPVWVIYK